LEFLRDNKDAYTKKLERPIIPDKGYLDPKIY